MLTVEKNLKARRGHSTDRQFTFETLLLTEVQQQQHQWSLFPLIMWYSSIQNSRRVCLKLDRARPPKEQQNFFEFLEGSKAEKKKFPLLRNRCFEFLLLILFSHDFHVSQNFLVADVLTSLHLETKLRLDKSTLDQMTNVTFLNSRRDFTELCSSELTVLILWHIYYMNPWSLPAQQTDTSHMTDEFPHGSTQVWRNLCRINAWNKHKPHLVAPSVDSAPPTANLMNQRQWVSFSFARIPQNLVGGDQSRVSIGLLLV